MVMGIHYRVQLVYLVHGSGEKSGKGVEEKQRIYACMLSLYSDK